MGLQDLMTIGQPPSMNANLAASTPKLKKANVQKMIKIRRTATTKKPDNNNEDSDRKDERKTPNQYGDEEYD